MFKKLLIIIMIFIIIPLKSVAAQDNQLAINATGAILIEANSRQILFEKKATERLYPASTTKIMTMILMFEALNKQQISFDDIVIASSYAASMGGSQIYLETGEKMSLKDLFKAIAIASANDASVAVGEYIGGTIDKFVAMMNDKAKELQLVNTHFENATGLHDDNHYTCAYDLAIMAAYLIEIGNQELLEVTSLYDSYIREDGKQSFWLVNTNKLLKQYNGVDGLKTGYTKEAGYCLVTTAKKDNQRLIGVLMQESAPKIRNQEMMELLDYGFNNFQVVTIHPKESTIEKTLIDKTDQLYLETYCKQDVTYTKEKTSKPAIETQTSYNQNLLPVKQDDQVGLLKVIIDGKEIATYPLYSKNALSKPTFLAKTIKTLKYLF